MVVFLSQPEPAASDGLDFACSSTDPNAPVIDDTKEPELLDGAEVTFHAETAPGKPLLGLTPDADGVTRVDAKVVPSFDPKGWSLGVNLDGVGATEFNFQAGVRAASRWGQLPTFPWGGPPPPMGQHDLFTESFGLPLETNQKKAHGIPTLPGTPNDSVKMALAFVRTVVADSVIDADVRAELTFSLVFKRTDGSDARTRVTLALDARGGNEKLPKSMWQSVAVKQKFDTQGFRNEWWGYGQNVDWPQGTGGSSDLGVGLVVDRVIGTPGSGTETYEPDISVALGWQQTPEDIAVGLYTKCAPWKAPGTSSTGQLAWNRSSTHQDGTTVDADAMAVDAEIHSGIDMGIGGEDEVIVDGTFDGVPERLDWLMHPEDLTITRHDRAADGDVLDAMDIDLSAIQLAADDPAVADDRPIVASGFIQGMPRRFHMTGRFADPNFAGSLVSADMRFCGDESTAQQPVTCDQPAAAGRVRAVIQNFFEGEAGSGDLPPAPAGPFVLYADQAARANSPAYWRLGGELAGVESVFFETEAQVDDADGSQEPCEHPATEAVESCVNVKAKSAGGEDTRIVVHVDGRTVISGASGPGGESGGGSGGSGDLPTNDVINPGDIVIDPGDIVPLPWNLGSLIHVDGLARQMPPTVEIEFRTAEPTPFDLEYHASQEMVLTGTAHVQLPWPNDTTADVKFEIGTPPDGYLIGPGVPKNLRLTMREVALCDAWNGPGCEGGTHNRLEYKADTETHLKAGAVIVDNDDRAQKTEIQWNGLTLWMVPVTQIHADMTVPKCALGTWDELGDDSIRAVDVLLGEGSDFCPGSVYEVDHSGGYGDLVEWIGGAFGGFGGGNEQSARARFDTLVASLMPRVNAVVDTVLNWVGDEIVSAYTPPADSGQEGTRVLSGETPGPWSGGAQAPAGTDALDPGDVIIDPGDLPPIPTFEGHRVSLTAVRAQLVIMPFDLLVPPELPDVPQPNVLHPYFNYWGNAAVPQGVTAVVHAADNWGVTTTLNDLREFHYRTEPQTVCLKSEPNEDPFVINAWADLSDEENPTRQLWADAELDRVPATIYARVNEDAANTPTDPWIWLSTQTCNLDHVTPPDLTVDDVSNARLDAVVRVGDRDALLALGPQPRPPRGNGIDVKGKVADDELALDVRLVLDLPRHALVFRPRVTSCTTSTPYPEIQTCQGAPHYEMNETTEVWVGWLTTLTRLGDLNAKVNYVAAPTATDLDIAAHVANVPGIFTGNARLVDNLRLPWTDVDVNMLGGTALGRIVVDITDNAAPSYRGDRANRALANPNNRTPNYHLELNNVTNKLDIRARLRDQETPNPIELRKSCTFNGHVLPAAERMGYLHAALDLHDKARSIELNMHSGSDESTNAPFNQRVIGRDNPKTALWVKADQPVDATVDLKIENFGEGQRTTKSAWFVLPLGESEVEVCLEFDLGLRVNLDEITDVKTGFQGSEFDVRLGEADLARGANAWGRFGEVYFCQVNCGSYGNGVWLDRWGAPFYYHRVWFDPVGPGEWEDNGTGWRNLAVHYLDQPQSLSIMGGPPILVTHGVRYWQDRNNAFDYAYVGQANAAKTEGPDLTHLNFLLDPLFGLGNRQSMKDRDDTWYIPGRPGHEFYSALESMGSPPSDLLFRLPQDLKRQSPQGFASIVIPDDGYGSSIPSLRGNRAYYASGTHASPDGTSYSVYLDEFECLNVVARHGPQSAEGMVVGGGALAPIRWVTKLEATSEYPVDPNKHVGLCRARVTANPGETVYQPRTKYSVTMLPMPNGGILVGIKADMTIPGWFGSLSPFFGAKSRSTSYQGWLDPSGTGAVARVLKGPELWAAIITGKGQNTIFGGTAIGTIGTDISVNGSLHSHTPVRRVWNWGDGEILGDDVAEWSAANYEWRTHKYWMAGTYPTTVVDYDTSMYNGTETVKPYRVRWVNVIALGPFIITPPIGGP
ncbi:MAG: hypothetical protein IT198_05555 [Acidimicrobiia bacterium]|nr:hypothetical protein [Acidimicrobiia bacterium]